MEYLVSRYADNTLSEPERNRARQLLKSNPDCRRWLAEHRQLQEVLDDWSNRLPMLDWNAFDTALAKRIDEKLKQRQTRAPRVRQWLGAIAVAGLAAITAATLWLTHPPARKDIPSFVQPVHTMAISPKLITRPAAVPMILKQTAKPAAAVKAVAKVSLHQPSKPKHALASKTLAPSLPPADRGYGVLPTVQTSHLPTGVADASNDSPKNAASPR